MLAWELHFEPGTVALTTSLKRQVSMRLFYLDHPP